MINREITYERNVSRSYMKIPAPLEATFDEDIILKKEIPGYLSVEKCYINGCGQFWYNITGKQALDSYTKMKAMGISFVEKLLFQICTQLENLEWHLIGSNCLVLDPEFIFISNSSEEIFFTLYPENKGEVHTELRKLIEYLLTRLDHKDTMAVKTLYAIYEITLSEGYSLDNIRDAMEQNKKPVVTETKVRELPRRENVRRPIPERDNPEKNIPERQIPERQIRERRIPEREIQAREETKKQEITWDFCKEKLLELWQKLIKKIEKEIKPEKKKAVTMVTYPDKIEEQKPVYTPTVNPTVCLVSSPGRAKGFLMHQGLGEYPDYELSEEKCVIGSHPESDLSIGKETISSHHASIEYKDGQYYIEDLNSTNGTYINGIAVNYKQKEVLHSGDEVRFANIRYRFL